MSEKKMVRKNVAIVVGISCIVLAACLVGAFSYYMPMVNDKDSTISSLNSQITNLQNQIQSDNLTISSLNSRIVDLENQLASNNSVIASDNATISNFQNQVTALLNRIASLQDQIQSDNLTISSLNSQIVVLDQQLTAYNTTAHANALTIYTWWTSGGESAALQNLLTLYESQYPSVTVIPDAVVGGAGYVLRSVIEPLVLAGEAPDSLQVHAGYEMYPYVSGNYLASIDDLWSSQGWASVMPSVIASEVQWNGDYYAVPLDIHRANVIWYNAPLLAANGINASTLTTWPAFFAACKYLSENSTLTSSSSWVSPIALGDADQWEATMVLEEMMAGQGMQFYQNFINGNITSASDPNLQAATTEFAEYLNYTNANHASLTWDEAAALVIDGQCAFNLMGDWNNGEFELANKIYGTDYGTFAAPGTANDYGLVIDCFEHPDGVKDPINSLNWLTVVGSVAGEMAFNPDMGSIPPRTDVLDNAADVAQFGPYQQAAIADFKLITAEGAANGYYLYPSFVHGSAMPESALTPFNTAVNAFVASARLTNSAYAISTLDSAMTSAITASQGDFVKTWMLTS